MEKLGLSHHNSNLPQKGPNVPSGLFFSPTANAGIHTPGGRGSDYLPAGFYATGSAVGAWRRADCVSQFISRIVSTIPVRSQPRSKSAGVAFVAPTGGQDSTYSRVPNVGTSRSTLNLAHPQGRAPSAYLEDLFENHPPISQGDYGPR
jgi:hypothetical protein